jgi:signal transduction histidine kinase
MFTSDEGAEMKARAAVTYLINAALTHLSKKPLAAVDELLEQVRSVAVRRSREESDIMDIAGSAGEGSITLSLSSGELLRFYNHRLFGNDESRTASRITDGRINDYLSWELLDTSAGNSNPGDEADPVSEPPAEENTDRPLTVTRTEPIVRRITDAVRDTGRVMVLVDGDPGSGKSSLVASSIRSSIRSSRVVALDEYVAPDGRLLPYELDAALTAADRAGVDVLVFEGVNLQYALYELKKLNFDVGGFVYQEMDRHPVSIRCRVADERQREQFIRTTSMTPGYARTRMNVKQLDKYALTTGYDFIFTREEGPGGSGRARRIYSLGGPFAAGVAASSMTGSIIPAAAGLTAAFMMWGILYFSDRKPSMRNPDDTAATLRGFLVAIPEIARRCCSRRELVERLNELARKMSVPVSVVRGDREIDELLKDIQLQRQLSERVVELNRAAREQRPDTALGGAYMGAGWAAGMIAGALLLYQHLGFAALPLSMAVSLAGLLTGWVIHEAGHYAGRKMGPFFEVRAGPAFSFLAGVPFAVTSLVCAFSGLQPFPYAETFFLVLALNYMAHSFGDAMILYTERRLKPRYDLERFMTTGFASSCTMEPGWEGEKEHFDTVAGVYRRTAGLKDLTVKRKMLIQQHLLNNINFLGSDTRRLLAQETVLDLLASDDPEVWGPVIELIIEDMAKADKFNSEKFIDLYHDLLTATQKLPRFVDAMVKLYVDAHEQDSPIELLFTDKYVFIDEVEKVFRHIAEENDILGDRMMAGISDYAGSDWVFNLDLDGISEHALRCFMRYVGEVEELRLPDRYGAQRFSEDYFDRVLKRSMENGHIRSTGEEEYTVTRKGLARLLKRAKLGILSFPEIMKLSRKYLPRAVEDMSEAIDRDKRESFRTMRFDLDIYVNAMRAYLGPVNELLRTARASLIARGAELTKAQREMLAFGRKLRRQLDDLDDLRKRLYRKDVDGTGTGSGKRDRYEGWRQERIAAGIMSGAEEVRDILEDMRKENLVGVFSDLADEKLEHMRSAGRNMILAYTRTAAFIRSGGTFDLRGREDVIDINDTLRLARESLTGRQEVVMEAGEGLPLVKADEMLLVEAWAGILRVFNGDVKKDGVKISVSIRPADRGRTVEVVISSQDMAMSAARLSELLESPGSVRSAEDVGVSLAARVIDNHKGTISFTSSPGEGTVFTVRLPAAGSKTISDSSITSVLVRGLEDPEKGTDDRGMRDTVATRIIPGNRVGGYLQRADLEFREIPSEDMDIFFRMLMEKLASGDSGVELDISPEADSSRECSHDGIRYMLFAVKGHPELMYDLLVVDEGIFDDCLAWGMIASAPGRTRRFHSYYRIKDDRGNRDITPGYTVERFYEMAQKAALTRIAGDERAVITRSRPESAGLPRPGTESWPGPPAGHASRAYKTLKEHESGERFGLSRFRKLREEYEGRSFSDTTMRVELRTLVDLGILEIIRGRTGDLYSVSPVYGRAPPEAHDRVERILAELHALPVPGEMQVARKKLGRLRRRMGIRVVARTVRESAPSGTPEHVIADLLLYWPERAINLSEKRSVLSLLSPEEGRFFLYASSLIHHKKIRKNGRLDLGVSIRALLEPARVPEPTAEERGRKRDSMKTVDAFAGIVEKARDLTGDEMLLRNPEEVETTIREMASIYRSFISMSGPGRWIIGRYFGFRAGGVDFNTGAIEEPELVARINDDRDMFFATLPEDIRRRMEGSLKSRYDEVSAAIEKGAPGQFDNRQIRAFTFMSFLSDLWMEHALIDRFEALDIGAMTDERGLRVEVVSQKGERAGRIKEHLERAVEMAEEGNFRKARRRAMRARLVHSDNPEVRAVTHYISELEDLAGIFRDARALRAMEQYLIEGRPVDDIAASYDMTPADMKRSLYGSLSVFRELFPSSVELDTLSTGMRTVYVAYNDPCILICDPESMGRRLSRDPRNVAPVPFVTAVPSRITRDKTIRLGRKGGDAGGEDGRVVLIERPGEGEIEVWASDRLRDRAYHYELTGDPAQAMDILLADPGRWLEAFGAERFMRDRSGEGGYEYTYYGTRGDLAVLAALGVLEREGPGYPGRYRLSGGSADVLFRGFLARLIYGSISGMPVTARIERTLELLEEARRSGIFRDIRRAAGKGERPGREAIEKAVTGLAGMAEERAIRLDARKTGGILRDRCPDLATASLPDQYEHAPTLAELHDHLPVPPEGSVYNAFKKITSDLDLTTRSFTRAEFRAKRKRKGSRKPLSYDVITKELRALTELGILNEEKRGREYLYTLEERFVRATPGILQDVLDALRDVPSDPRSAAFREGAASIRAQIDTIFRRGGQDGLFRPRELSSHRGIILYYLKHIPLFNLRLIRLSSERAHLASLSAGDGPETEGEENIRTLEECQAEIDRLAGKMRTEFSLLPERTYPVSLTGGRDLRKEAAEKMERALEWIEKHNEPAAGALLCAAARLLGKELRYLSDASRKERRGALSWHDRKRDLDHVVRGQFRKEELVGGREHYVKRGTVASSQLTWQALRSFDHQFEGILHERDWLKENIERSKRVIDELNSRRNAVSRGRRANRRLSRFPVPDHLKEEMDIVLEAARKMNASGKAFVMEKEIIMTTSSLVDELAKLGETAAALSVLTVINSLMRTRLNALENQLTNIRGGKLKELRGWIHQRNGSVVYKARRITELIRSGRTEEARRWIMGMTRQAFIRKEPEFHRMVNLLWNAENVLRSGADPGTAEKSIRALGARGRMAELLNSFMEDVRDQYVERRLDGAGPDVLHAVFYENFNRYLSYARKRNIGRGSPRLLWAFFYLPLNVSRTVRSTENPSRKTDNPLFKAFQIAVRMLEVDSIPRIADHFSRQQKSYGELFSVLDRAIREGWGRRISALDGEELEAVLAALAGDLALDGEGKAELLKIAAIDEKAVELADIRPVSVTFGSMYEDLLKKKDDPGSTDIRRERTRRFIELFKLSREPASWSAEADEPWEREFIREISGLSADELADRFLSYQSNPLKGGIKDLRELRNVFTTVLGRPDLEDIYLQLIPEQFEGLGGRDILDKFKRPMAEQVWILREWIYRHWNGGPRENSYQRMRRAEVRSRRTPPKGSIHGVFRYLCDRGVTSEREALPLEELSRDIGRAPDTIRPDVRALVHGLGLARRVHGSGGSGDPAYYVTKRAAAMRERILSVLEMFQGSENLRPSSEKLDRVYREWIRPLTALSDREVRTGVTLASFGHGTNYPTEVFTKVSALAWILELLDENIREEVAAEVVPAADDMLRDLHEGTDALIDLHREAYKTIRGGEPFNADKDTMENWRNRFMEAVDSLSAGTEKYYRFKERLRTADIAIPDETVMFAQLLEEVIDGLRPMLEDRVMLIQGHIAEEAVDLDRLLAGFYDSIFIKPGEMTEESFSVDRPERPVPVKGNELSLISMICNIAANGAQEAFKKHGHDARVRISLREKAGKAVITIQDNGPGMTPGQIESIKRPFYTTGGTGIGTTEAKLIIEDHNGDLDIQSEPGKGTVFTIRLPLYDPEKVFPFSGTEDAATRRKGRAFREGPVINGIAAPLLVLLPAEVTLGLIGVAASLVVIAAVLRARRKGRESDADDKSPSPERVRLRKRMAAAARVYGDSSQPASVRELIADPRALLVLSGTRPAAVIDADPRITDEQLAALKERLGTAFEGEIYFDRIADPDGGDGRYVYLLADIRLCGEFRWGPSDKGFDEAPGRGRDEVIAEVREIFSPEGANRYSRALLLGVPRTDVMDERKYHRLLNEAGFEDPLGVDPTEPDTRERLKRSFRGGVEEKMEFIQKYYLTAVIGGGADSYDLMRFARLAFYWKSMRPVLTDKTLEEYMDALREAEDALGIERGYGRDIYNSVGSAPLEFPPLPLPEAASPRDKAVYAISDAYSEGRYAAGPRTLEGADDSVFLPTDTSTLLLISKLFLTGKERVLDLGSGNAKAVSVFSRYAESVKGVELKTALHEEGKRYISGLAEEGLVDTDKVELVNADFMHTDLSGYDLIYIYWPNYMGSRDAVMKNRLEEKLSLEMKEDAVFVINNCEHAGRFTSLRKIETPVDDSAGIAFYTRAGAERVPRAAAVEEINSARFESGVILSNWRGKCAYVPDTLEPDTHCLVYTFASGDDPRGEKLREHARRLKALRTAGLKGLPTLVGKVHPFRGETHKAPLSLSDDRHVLITRVAKRDAKDLWGVDVNPFALNRLASENLNFYLNMLAAGYVPGNFSTMRIRTARGEPLGPDDLGEHETVFVEDNGLYRGFYLKGLINHAGIGKMGAEKWTPRTVGHLCEWFLSVALFGLDNGMDRENMVSILELGFHRILDEEGGSVPPGASRDELRAFIDELAAAVDRREDTSGGNRMSLPVRPGKLVSAVKGLVGTGASPVPGDGRGLPDDDPLASMKNALETRLVPEMVNGLITTGYRNKFVLAFDSGIMEASGREGLSEVVKALKDLGLRQGRLGDFLRDVVIKTGDSADLAQSLTSMVDKGLDRGKIVIITRKSEIPRFTGFSGSSVITAVDDDRLTPEWYYPLPQVVLFSLARALRYERESLLRCYRDIPNIADLPDDRIWDLCWDGETGQYRPTVVIELVPGAVRITDKDIYRDIARIISSAA